MRALVLSAALVLSGCDGLSPLPRQQRPQIRYRVSVIPAIGDPHTFEVTAGVVWLGDGCTTFYRDTNTWGEPVGLLAHVCGQVEVLPVEEPR